MIGQLTSPGVRRVLRLLGYKCSRDSSPFFRNYYKNIPGAVITVRPGWQSLFLTRDTEVGGACFSLLLEDLPLAELIRELTKWEADE